MNKYSFTKENTNELKGIAIIFLLMYHCFSNEDRITVPGTNIAVKFWPLAKETVMYMSSSMFICVGIFTFLSVYGLTLSMKKRFPNFNFTGKEATLYVIRRYLVILSIFFIPFLFCEIVSVILGHTQRYGTNIMEQIGNFLLDMLCLSDIFQSKLLVQTWWYLSLLVTLTVFTPLLIQLYKRYSWLSIAIFFIFGEIFFDTSRNILRWLSIVPVAICFADKNVLERIRAIHIVKNPKLNKVLKFFFMTLIMITLTIVRKAPWSVRHILFLTNCLVTISVICWSYEFFIELPVIKQVLVFLGKHSADIFFVHLFIRQIWFKKALYSLESVWLIFLTLLFVSLLISVSFDLFKKLIKYDKITNHIADKTLKWCDKVL